MEKRERKTAAMAWLEKTNPLRGLSIRDAQMIFDTARAGDTQRLHWLFQEIEAVNPVLMTCVERRASAIVNFQWAVTARPETDGALGNEQRDAATRFFGDIENFSEMLEHLDLAFFRGFSFVQPIWESDTVRRVALPDSWEFLSKDGRLYHNPACDGFGPNAVEVTPEARLFGVRRRRSIDYPALSVHIREAVGERDWGRFLERYALPKPAVFMHPGATNEQREDYLVGAAAVENGQVAVFPNGANMIDFAGGSRGTDPFNSFIEYQQKMILLLATGGTLTSLAQADTGSLAGGAQMQVWREIVARDSALIAQAVTRGLLVPFLEAAFPGKARAVDFGFDTATKPTPQEAANVAATLKQAGWIVDKDELESATGFTLEKDTSTPPQIGFQGAFKAGEDHADGKTPFKNAEKPFKNAPGNSDGQGDGTGVDALAEAFSRVLAESMAEALTEETHE